MTCFQNALVIFQFQLNSTQENIAHALEDQKLPPNVEKVMQEMVRQMDVLTQTVAILEQRLYNMESKLDNEILKKQIDSVKIDGEETSKE